MKHLAIRHRRAALKAIRLGALAPSVQKYEIIDPDHRPDLRGHFVGQPVVIESGKQFVWLTPRQARFPLDQGSIQLANQPPAEEQPAA